MNEVLFGLATHQKNIATKSETFFLSYHVYSGTVSHTHTNIIVYTAQNFKQNKIQYII